MGKSALIAEPDLSKVRPHIVRQTRGGGDRYYVYAYRGGPIVLQRDGERPTDEEAASERLTLQQLQQQPRLGSILARAARADYVKAN